ncbi:hypothetical protein CA833_03180 [Novosphingobium sp. KA1]|nr:hypothetical protein CA833_03180 [Novosphingobium sp. KA1]
MQVIVLRQLCQRPLALDRGKRYLRLECRAVVAPGSSAHSLLLSCSLPGCYQAENPIISVCRFSRPPLWHEMIGAPTIADAILDRLVHNAHRITLEGDSMRKTRAAPLLTDTEKAEIITA